MVIRVVRRLIVWLVAGLLALMLLFVSRDTVRYDLAQEAAASYTYDLIVWEAKNFLSKWLHRVSRALPWNSQDAEGRKQKVYEYFELGARFNELTSEVDRAAARTDGNSSGRIKFLEAELEEISSRRKKLRDDVEEVLEAHISSVVAAEGLEFWREIIFPPVDIRLIEAPKLLVTSPRDRIDRTHDVLLDPNVEVAERKEVEDKLFNESKPLRNRIEHRGVATYPASLPNNRPLGRTLRTSAHEWLHHYLFFQPLGQNMFSSQDMQILNETLADVAGDEIGNRALDMLGADPESRRGSIGRGAGHSIRPRTEGFEFNPEMRITRRRVDELLSQGRIEEAEAYMEQRRLVFAENGFDIRKINQAWFAFNGTYAESSASVSPIGGQLNELRTLTPDLGTFIKTVAGISSYQRFLEKLEELKARASE